MFMKASVLGDLRSASHFKRLRYHYSDQTHMGYPRLLIKQLKLLTHLSEILRWTYFFCGFGINFRQFTSPIHDEAQNWIIISN